MMDGIERRLNATKVRAPVVTDAAAKEVASTREIPGGFSMNNGIRSGSRDRTSSAVAEGWTVHTIASG
jgi:hypothetical protein